MKVSFPHVIRQGMQVATACCEEIIGSPSRRPVLLSLFSKDGNKRKETKIVFRFEGGVVVKVFLYDLSQLAESWRNTTQDWVVTRAISLYYPTKTNYSHSRGPDRENKKVIVENGPRSLRLIKESRWWHSPRIMAREEIKGSIGIFWDNASQDGDVKVDYDCNQDGFYTLAETLSYSVLIPGDRERAEKEAWERLQKY